MTSAAIPDTTHSATRSFRFSYVLLLAIALNFLWADGHDQQRCIELATVGLGLLGTLFNGQLARALQAVPLLLRSVCLLFLALGACASIGVVSASRAAGEWSMFVMIGLAVIVVAAEFAASDAAARYRLLQVIGGLCGLYSLRILLVYAAALAAHAQIDLQGLSAAFSNIRFFNHAQTALLPLLALLIAVSARASWTRRIAFLVAAYWWSLIFFSESRATMLALAAGVAVALVVRGRQSKPVLKTLAATALAGAVLYVLLYFLIPAVAGLEPYGMSGRLIARSAADPISGRQFLWRRAAELIAHHPLLGVGPQHFAHFGADLQTGAHPHDWMLQIAAEWGLPALLCVLVLLGAGMRGLLRASKMIGADGGLDQAMCTTWIVAVTGVVVDSLFSGVLVMPQSQMTLVLVSGAAIGWVRSLRVHQAPDTSIATHVVVAVLALSALGTLAYVAGPDAARKWENGPLTPTEQASNPNLHWPRLWEAGFF